MNMYIWVIGTLNQLFVRGFYTQIKFSKKNNEIVSGKNSFFVIGSFVLPIQFVLTLAFDRVVLYLLQFFKKSFSFSENLFLIQGIENMIIP